MTARERKGATGRPPREARRNKAGRLPQEAIRRASKPGKGDDSPAALRAAVESLELEAREHTQELRRESGERQASEEKLRLAAKVIDSLGEAVIVLDADFRVLSLNAAFTQITGYELEDIAGRQPHFYRAIGKDATLFADMWAVLEAGRRWEGEYWDRRKSGEDYAERVRVSAIADEVGRVHQYAAVITDITKHKQDEERILNQANYDALTGLPNRSLFLDRLGQALSNMSRTGSRLGLMFIDLDGFKLVNDTLGHDMGDLLLKEAAGRLSECIRTGDTVARLGGDEFTVIMPNLVDPRHTPLVAQRALDLLSKPYLLGGHEAIVSASIGITIYPDDAIEASELLKNADTAMYRAKEQGKANFQFFTADLNRELKERLVIKNGLGKALERNEFQLHYQPKLELAGGSVSGVEALMRWRNAALGNIPPAKFIPILEETGMVVEVGEWAIRSACRQHVAWREAGLPPLRIAVNLSARQLRELSFVSVVERVLAETGVAPEFLEIEITESMLMSDTARTVVTLRTLHERGVRVAMDDFGTGYSSLSYLRRFPIDTIKIDRSFVGEIATNADDAEIIRAIISMGRTLNRKVIAEGVETEEQLQILKDYRCDEIQGYLFSPPLPADRMAEFLKQRANPAA